MNGIPRLEFNMQLAGGTGWELTEGTLLIKKDDNAGVKLRATSGLAGYQAKGSWRIKGRGYIPPSVQITPQQWNVSTQKLWLPDVRGVEGSFYAIAPFSVNLGGLSRGDFGIHADAGFPAKSAGNAGSAGCIVIRQQDHWDEFRKQMQLFRVDGHQQIALFISYD